jgi:hypothetical protein
VRSLASLASTIHCIDDEIVQWAGAARASFQKAEAARRRLLNSKLMIVDQAAINAGFAFRRLAIKPIRRSRETLSSFVVG